MRERASIIAVSNDELFTVREAMRELNRILARIESGEIEKAILMQHGKMVAAVVPLGALQRIGSAQQRAAIHREIAPQHQDGR